MEKSLIPNLQGTYKIKVQRINTLSYETFPILRTILQDMYWKYNNVVRLDNKQNILFKAREENIDFELELSLMITGDDDSFPYRSSSKLTKFFENLGYDFMHTGETRKDKLAILNITEIKELIRNGLLKKKYYIEYVKKVNQDNIQKIDVNAFYKKSIKEFEYFIQNSITSNQPFIYINTSCFIKLFYFTYFCRDEDNPTYGYPSVESFSAKLNFIPVSLNGALSHRDTFQ